MSAKGRVLTAATLRDKGACEPQVDEFVARWGESVEITPELCASVASVFSWCWAAKELLTAPALAEYERVEAPALAEYRRVRAPALVEYLRAMAPSWAEYQRVEAPAWAEYERVMAPAFALAYIGDAQEDKT